MYIVKREFCDIEIGTKLPDNAVPKEFEKELIESGTLEFILNEPTPEPVEPTAEPVQPMEETPAPVTPEPVEPTAEPVTATKSSAKPKK